MRITLCFAVVLIAVSFAEFDEFGSDYRLLLDDYHEIFAYPGTIENYQFSVITSVEGDDGWELDYFGGAMDVDGTIWGGLHNHNGYMLSVLYHAGDFGLITELDYATDPDHDETIKSDEVALGVDFGIELDIFGDYTDLAAGVAFEMVKLTNAISDSVDMITEDGTVDIGISLRGHDRDALFNLFPIIDVGIVIDNEKVTLPDSTVNDGSETVISLSIGAGMNKMLAENTHFIGGVFININRTSETLYEGSNPDPNMSIDLLDFHIGLEQQLLPWMRLNGGASAVTNYSKAGDADDATIATTYGSAFGIGFDVANWSLDAGISQDFLHAGPNVVGGEANGFLGDLEIVYTF